MAKPWTRERPLRYAALTSHPAADNAAAIRDHPKVGFRTAGVMGGYERSPDDAPHSWDGRQNPGKSSGSFSHAVKSARSALGEDAFTTAWAVGHARSLEEAITDALGDDE